MFINIKDNTTLNRFISKKSRKALALSPDNDTKGVIVLADVSNSPEQIFRLINKGDYFIIESTLNNTVLSVFNSSRNPGAAIITLPEHSV